MIMYNNSNNYSLLLFHAVATMSELDSFGAEFEKFLSTWDSDNYFYDATGLAAPTSEPDSLTTCTQQHEYALPLDLDTAFYLDATQTSALTVEEPVSFIFQQQSQQQQQQQLPLFAPSSSPSNPSTPSTPQSKPRRKYTSRRRIRRPPLPTQPRRAQRPEKKFPCTWPAGCTHAPFTCPHNVAQHIREVHTHERPFECERCRAAGGKMRAFARPWTLYRHLRDVHGIVDDEGGRKELE